MKTVTKKDIICKIAKNTNTSKQKAQQIIEAFLNNTKNALKAGNRIEIRDFGVFEPKKRGKRVGRNPRTGEQVQIPPKIVVTFKVGKELKKLVLNSKVY